MHFILPQCSGSLFFLSDADQLVVDLNSFTFELKFNNNKQCGLIDGYMNDHFLSGPGMKNIVAALNALESFGFFLKIVRDEVYGYLVGRVLFGSGS